MISAFDDDQSFRIAGRLIQLAPLINRNDRIVGSVSDHYWAFHAGYFARRLEAVSGQEVQSSWQPWKRYRAHIARRTQSRFDDQRPAGFARRDIYRRGSAERLAVKHELFTLHAALAHEVIVDGVGVGIESPLVRQTTLAAPVAAVIEDHRVETELRQ